MRERVSPLGAPPRRRMLRGASQAGGVLLSPTGSIDERLPSPPTARFTRDQRNSFDSVSSFSASGSLSMTLTSASAAGGGGAPLPPPSFASTPISIRSAMSGATAAVPSRGSEDNLLLHSARSSGLLHSQGSLQEFLKDGGGGGTPESVDKPADASHKMF